MEAAISETVSRPPGQMDKRKKRSETMRKLYLGRYLYMLFIPAVVYFIVFHYIPMAGILIAFFNFNPYDSIFNSKWIGLRHFIDFVTYPGLPRLIRNTAIISSLKILFGFPLPIIFAIVLNEVKRIKFKKVVQTISYFPHFISWVIVYGLALNLFSPSFGMVNLIIKQFGGEPVNFLMQKSFFVPLLVGSGVYVSYGWSSIIYIATIAGINDEYYEAAWIDGAGRLRQIWHITLPELLPMITFSLIGIVSAIFSCDFQQIMIMMGSGQNKSLLEVGDVIDYYIYRVGMEGALYSFSTAATIVKSIVSLILIQVSNKIANSVGQMGLW